MFQQTVSNGVESVLNKPMYQNLGIVSVRTQYGGTAPISNPEAVIITVSAPNSSYRALSRQLERRIEVSTGDDVRVDVQFSA